MIWPHGFNALKYIVGLTNAYIGWLYNNNKVSMTVYIVVGLAAVSYMLFWDFYMDWGLFRADSKLPLLRKNMMYPPYYYYCAMCFNFVFRLIWLMNFIKMPFLSKVTEGELKAIFFSAVEILRRTIWALFRVEHENVNNPEKYRAILEIPNLPEKFMTSKD